MQSFRKKHRNENFSLYWRKGDTLVDGVETFKYLGRPLDQTYGEWTVVRRNIKRARRVWGRLGKMLRREGADTKVATILYRAVVHAVIPFGS